MNNINYTFLLKKKPSLTNTLIYYCKLEEPIGIGSQKCISHLSLRGYRAWLNDYEESYFHNILNADDYEIIVKFNNSYDAGETIKIRVPFEIFLFQDLERSVAILKKKLSEIIKLEDFNLYIINNNFIYFKILNLNISITFSEALCNFFGFTKNLFYDNQSLTNIFIYRRHFFDRKCENIGIQLNFAYNSNLHSQCVCFMHGNHISLGDYFHENLINQKQKLTMKFDTLQEIELRFINLYNNKIMRGFSYELDYIQVDLCFSLIN